MNITNHISLGLDAAGAYVLLVLAALIFASNHIIGRYLHDLVPPFGLVFWRFAIGGLIILPFAWRSFYLNLTIIRQHLWLFIFLSVLFVLLGQGLIYLSYHWTTATNGGVISTVQPALTVALSAILFRDFINKKQAAGLITATIGVLVIISRGNLEVLIHLKFNLGDLTLICAMFAGALYNVLLRKIPPQIDVFLLTLIIQIIGIIVAFPIYLAETIIFRPVPFTSEVILALLWIGVVVAALAVALNNAVIRSLGANKASIGNYLRAIFTTLLAILLLGESFEIYHGVALVLVIGGVWLISISKSVLMK